MHKSNLPEISLHLFKPSAICFRLTIQTLETHKGNVVASGYCGSGNPKGAMVIEATLKNILRQHAKTIQLSLFLKSLTEK